MLSNMVLTRNRKSQLYEKDDKLEGPEESRRKKNYGRDVGKKNCGRDDRKETYSVNDSARKKLNICVSL